MLPVDYNISPIGDS